MKFLKNIFGKIKTSNEIRYNLNDVYTPGIIAKLAFVERNELIDKIVDAIETPGKQIILYGNSGSGKTTLIQNILIMKSIKYITYNCTSDSTYDDLIRHTFDQLNCYYTYEVDNRESMSIKSEISLNYLAIKAKLESNISNDVAHKKQRLLPPELTIQNLSKFLGIAETYWIIEDFHKVETSERKRIAQTLKLMSDAATSFPNAKVIAIGAVDTATQLIELDTDITNRVAQIHIPLMNRNELKSIIEKGESLLKINFSPEIKNDIINHSHPMAVVCHQLSRSMCRKANILETQDSIVKITNIELLEQAIKDWVTEHSETYSKDFEKAFSNVESSVVSLQNILLPFCNSNKELLSFDDIYHAYNTKEKEEKKRTKGIKKATLRSEIDRLTGSGSGEILIKNEQEKYRLRTPFFKVFLMMSILRQEPKPLIVALDDNLLSIKNIIANDDVKFNLTFKFVEAVSEIIQSKSKEIEKRMND